MEPVRFNLTEAIVVKATQLHGTKYVVRFLSTAAIVGVMVSAYFLIGSDDLSIERILVQVLLTVIAALCAAGFVVALLQFWINPLYARRNFRQQKMLAQEMTLSWTEERYLFALGNSQTDMAFADLYGYRANSDFVLLYLSEALFHIVPLNNVGNTTLERDFLEKLDIAGVKRR